MAGAATSSIGRMLGRLEAQAVRRPDRSPTLLVAAVGIVLLAEGMGIYFRYDPGWEGWLRAAVLLLALAPLVPHRVERLLSTLTWERLLVLTLGVGIVAGCLDVLLTDNGSLPDRTADLVGLRVGVEPMRVLLAATGLLALSGLLPRAPLGRWHLPVLLVCTAILGTWIIRSGEPGIDVFTFERDAAKALLSGTDPYSIVNHNIYPDASSYPPGWVDGDIVNVGYTYPPLTLLFYAPAQLLSGDVRYGNLVALLGAAALIGWMRPTRLARGAAGLLVATPILLMALHESFTEPIALLMLAACVAAALRAPRWVGAALGLFLVAKQYLVLVAPLALLLLRPGMTRRDVGRQVLAVILAAAIVTLPFVLWDVGDYWRSQVEYFAAMPARTSSFSFLARITALVGGEVPRWLPAIPVAMAWAIALGRNAWTPSGFAMGTGLVLVAFFAVASQAFPNYHLLVVGAGCAAIAAARLGETGGGPRATEPQGTEAITARAAPAATSR